MGIRILAILGSKGVSGLRGRFRRFFLTCNYGAFDSNKGGLGFIREFQHSSLLIHQFDLSAAMRFGHLAAPANSLDGALRELKMIVQAVGAFFYGRIKIAGKAV